MNLNLSPDAQQLADLFATADDGAGDHVLWADTEGNVQLSCLDPNANEFAPANARLLYAPFEKGDGTVGEDASRDDELMADLTDSLRHHWLLATGAPTGVITIGLDDPETGAGWSLSEVTVVDQELLDSLNTKYRH